MGECQADIDRLLDFGLERQLRAANGGNRAYVWGLPAAALVLCFTILVVAGALSGASPAEVLPIAIFEGLVISGLFVACMLPPTGIGQPTV